MGLGKKANQVNIIDFGLAKKYRDPKTHQVKNRAEYASYFLPVFCESDVYAAHGLRSAVCICMKLLF